MFWDFIEQRYTWFGELGRLLFFLLLVVLFSIYCYSGYNTLPFFFAASFQWLSYSLELLSSLGVFLHLVQFGGG